MISQIQRRSAVDACAEALRQAILRGEYEAGGRLPPERELAESFGVNRVTVRSALARLAQARLLSVRQGSGYQVRDYLAEAGPELIPALVELASGARLAKAAADLLLVRRALARALLERLAQGSTAKARAEISKAVEGLEEALRAGVGPEALAEADLAVLRKVVAASGSAVLALCLNPISAALSALPRLREAVYADLSESPAAYRALLAWMEAPDLELIGAFVDGLAARDAASVARLEARR